MKFFNDFHVCPKGVHPLICVIVYCCLALLLTWLGTRIWSANELPEKEPEEKTGKEKDEMPFSPLMTEEELDKAAEELTKKANNHDEDH